MPDLGITRVVPCPDQNDELVDVGDCLGCDYCGGEEPYSECISCTFEKRPVPELKLFEVTYTESVLHTVRVRATNGTMAAKMIKEGNFGEANEIVESQPCSINAIKEIPKE